MASLVATIDANAAAQNKKMDGVASYMKNKKFPKLLRRKVRAYFKHYYDIHTAVDEKEILSNLPSHLQSEVALHLVNDSIVSLDIFENIDPGMFRTPISSILCNSFLDI